MSRSVATAVPPARRTRRPAGSPAVRAALYTVASVVVLAALFRTRPATTTTTVPARPLAEVSMLPLVAADDHSLPPWQRDLVTWLQLLHPTILSIPTDLDPLFKPPPSGALPEVPGLLERPVTSSQVSFSQVRQHDFERPHHSASAPDEIPPLLPAATYDPPLLTLPLADLVTTLESDWRHRPPALLNAAGNPPLNPVGAVITDINGAPVPELPPLATAQVLAATTTLTCRGPTTVTVVPSGALVRVTLAVSCGNAALDGVALAHVRREVTHLAALAEPAADASAPWLAHAHTLRIYWRYVPGMVETRDAADLATPTTAWPSTDWPGNSAHAID